MNHKNEVSLRNQHPVIKTMPHTNLAGKPFFVPSILMIILNYGASHHTGRVGMIHSRSGDLVEIIPSNGFANSKIPVVPATAAGHRSGFSLCFRLRLFFGYPIRRVRRLQTCAFMAPMALSVVDLRIFGVCVFVSFFLPPHSLYNGNARWRGNTAPVRFGRFVIISVRAMWLDFV